MNSLYNLAARQIAAIRADVEAYSTDPFSGSNNKAQINTAFATLLKTIEDYEGMANRELVVAKREKALGRAANFRSEAKQLRELLSYTDAKNSSRLAASALPTASMTSAPRSRAMDTSGGATTLIMDQGHSHPMLHTYTRPSLPSQYSIPSGPTPHNYGVTPSYDPLSAYKMNQPNAPFGTDSPYSMRESHALREHSFIQNTEAQLDAFIEQGRSVLGNLVEQRGILKGTRKRLLDAANTVGLSREIIGFIDRMGVQDRIIFAGGAIFTLFAFYMIYRWLG